MRRLGGCRQQQRAVIGINDARKRRSAKLAIELVALEPVAVEVGYSRPAKQKSRLAFCTFDFAKPNSLFVCCGHYYANKALGRFPLPPIRRPNRASLEMAHPGASPLLSAFAAAVPFLELRVKLDELLLRKIGASRRHRTLVGWCSFELSAQPTNARYGEKAAIGPSTPQSHVTCDGLNGHRLPPFILTPHLTLHRRPTRRSRRSFAKRVGHCVF